MGTILVRRPGEAAYAMDEGVLRALPAGSYPPGTEMRPEGMRAWGALPAEMGGALGVPGEGLWVRGPAGDLGPYSGERLRELVAEGRLAAGAEVYWEGAATMATAGQALEELEAGERAAAGREARRRRDELRAAGDAMLPRAGEYGAGMAGLGWMVAGGGVVLVGLGAALPGAGALALAGLGQAAVVVGGVVLVGDAVARRFERALGKAEKRKG